MKTLESPVIEPGSESVLLPPREQGLEYGALVSTRRWLIVMGTAVAYGVTFVFGLAVFPRTSPAEHVLLAVSAALVVIGMLGSRRSAFLWILTAGIVVVLVSTAFAPTGSARWIPLNLLMGYVSYYMVMLTSRRLGLLLAPMMVVVMMIVWRGRPSNVIVANLATFGGWVAALQLLCSTLLLWWTWNRLKSEAATADQGIVEVERRTIESLREQERARLWRQTAVQLHESVLNTVRYVLTAPTIDRARLSTEIERERSTPVPATVNDALTVATLFEAVRADPVLVDVVSVTGWAPDVPLDGDVFEAARAATVELGRNAVRHSKATRVELSARSGLQGQIILRLVDNGLGTDEAGAPGVGTATVLNAALQEVGATWSRESLSGGASVSRIIVPRRGDQNRRDRGRRTYPPFDKGRLLVTSVLVGISVGGTVNFLRMAAVGGTAERIAAVLGLFGIAVAAVVLLRRRRVHRGWALALVLAPAMVPWFLLGDQYSCAEAAPLSPVLNIAGYCVMVIAVWSGVLPGVVGVSVWAASGALLVTSIPAGCRDSVAVALVNSLVALPVILSVTYTGARAYQRAQDDAQETREREISERTAAVAARDINNQLDDSVHQAEVVLARIVAGADVDDDVRRELEQLDGRIRAGIQVDPESDGSVAVLAKVLVDEAADQGIRVSVRAISCSNDVRPVPRDVARLLYRVLVTPVPEAPRLHVFTDGEEDHLSVVTDREALRAASLEPGSDFEVGDFVVEVDDDGEDEDSRFAILVSRRIELREPAVT